MHCKTDMPSGQGKITFTNKGSWLICNLNGIIVTIMIISILMLGVLSKLVKLIFVRLKLTAINTSTQNTKRLPHTLPHSIYCTVTTITPPMTTPTLSCCLENAIALLYHTEEQFVLQVAEKWLDLLQYTLHHQFDHRLGVANGYDAFSGGGWRVGGRVHGGEVVGIATVTVGDHLVAGGWIKLLYHPIKKKS